MTGADVETPAVPVALDRVAAQVAVCERRAFVRAEIFDGVELSLYIVECQFRAISQLDGCAAPRRDIFDAPDRHGAPVAFGFFEVAEFRIERLHDALNRNKRRLRAATAQVLVSLCVLLIRRGCLANSPLHRAAEQD